MAWTTPVIHAVGDVLTASDWNISSNDLIYLYGDLSWTPVSYTNGWANVIACQFRKIGTRVVCKGAMGSGTINATAFTFPSGYRPTQNCDFIGFSNTSPPISHLAVSTAGVVNPVTGSNASVSIDSIAFDTI